jgi:hypothetical protein
MDNKDLIKQYIDTGFKIPEYQVIKLSNNDKKTYIRKRLVVVTLIIICTWWKGDMGLFYEGYRWQWYCDKMLTKTPEHLIHNLVDYTIDNKLDINADLFYFSSLEYKMHY